MSREAQAILSLLLMAACAATVIAQEAPPPATLPTFPGLLPPGFLPPWISGLLPPGIPGLLPPAISRGIPGLFPPRTPGPPSLLPPGIPGLLPPGVPTLSPPGKPDDRAECWSSLKDIPGCAWEIYTSVFTGKLAAGPACCKALQAIDKNCLSKLLPPFFPPLPKSNCAPGN